MRKSWKRGSEDELAAAQTARKLVQDALFVLDAAACDERGAEADEVSGIVPWHRADKLVAYEPLAERLAVFELRTVGGGFRGLHVEVEAARETCGVLITGSNRTGVFPELGTTSDVAFFVGPEGGFTDAETDAMFAAGAIPLRIGDWTLRVETAAIAGLGVLNVLFNSKA